MNRLPMLFLLGG